MPAAIALCSGHDSAPQGKMTAVDNTTSGMPDLAVNYGEGGLILTAILRGGDLVLDPPALTLTAADLFGA